MEGNKNIVGQRKHKLTHFLSIPITDPDDVKNFKEFTIQVHEMNNPGVTKWHFQKTCKLHLTLGVPSFFTDDEKQSAIQTLQECKEIVDSVRLRFNISGDLKIKISGIKCMNDNPSK
ncbi:Activating signal cointegrator 1 complex subunit 1 [Pseudolycoriella hygida]|uniref:Activating signal cointegrator 1 complex subunit 1 n=1 Tax=Pseudolycoriella hygida TaxID=35572 RepID=A0A9Q0S1N8_9DIPT|nr:Activating signal cointegrator 1 complex subunit 1 [Pseudolycoriella hygida]